MRSHVVMVTEQSGPTVHKVTRHHGVAGQVEITATVQYPGEETRQVKFVGSVYGGPVVMVSDTGAQVFVSDPGRFGEKLTTTWAVRFFAAS